jgi:hypothetical protein
MRFQQFASMGKSSYGDRNSMRGLSVIEYSQMHRSMWTES